MTAQNVSSSPVMVRLLYHVPRSQVWEGSRGAQVGHVHVHFRGRPLCGRQGWYERPPNEGETLCPRCEKKAIKLGGELAEAINGF